MFHIASGKKEVQEDIAEIRKQSAEDFKQNLEGPFFSLSFVIFSSFY
jgi:hypothetical protein